jgi:peptidoglycan/LPS O-acetylase OafA/YrhL
MDAPRRRLDALAGLRFAAALGILFFHYGGPLTASAPAWMGRLRTGGYAWVGLFYLLSGFVLARANPTPLTGEARRAFLAARLARLYPAYLLAFLLFTPFAVARGWGEGPLAFLRLVVVVAACLLLAQAWVPHIARIWNAPGWSTSVVASFYVAFPLLTARLAPLSRRRLAACAAGAWALALAFPLIYLLLQPDGPGAVDLAHEPFWLEALKFHPLARAGEFVLGVCLGLLSDRGLSLGRAGGAVALAGLATSAWALSVATSSASYVLLHNGLLLPAHALVVLGLAGAPRSLIARLLGCRPAVALGNAAFALYALQEPLWRWARWIGGTREEPSSAFVLCFTAAVAAVAVAVSRGLETPARRWLRARLLGAGARAATPRPSASPPAPASRAPA